MQQLFYKGLLGVLFFGLPFFGMAKTIEKKARVIVLTDGEVDDQSSMIRFLLYTCDIDLLAIIETNSVYQPNGHSREDWLEKQLEAYGQVYPLLIRHRPDYPTADEIKSKCFVGDEDIEHLINVRSRDKRKTQIPGDSVEYRPDAWSDTPGSDRIVEILLDKDSSPVFIQVWGGGNTASRAFYKLKNQYPNNYDRAVSKVVMYNIWYQDDAGNYIETFHPNVTMLYCASFSGTWDYKSQPGTTGFITGNVKSNHGPLGVLYPQTYISEGDSPSYFYTMFNGLRNYENPSYGGWGGRFVKLEAFPKGYTDASESGDVKQSMRRWIYQVNNDFQARMDWCVASKFSDANHAPVVKFAGKTNMSVKPGQIIKASAQGSKDPDGDHLMYKWWQYKEAGTYPGFVEIKNSLSEKSSIHIPKDQVQGTIHIILEVTDDGEPSLVTYKRIILDVK